MAELKKSSSKKRSKKSSHSEEKSTEPSKFELDKNLEKLIPAKDVELIRTNFHRTHEFLTQIGIGEMQVNENTFTIVIPFEYEDTNYTSHILISPEWTLIKCSILELEKIQPADSVNLMFELLKANFLLNHVTFSIDPEWKSVWLEADISAKANLELFKESYFSIIFGIDYFVKNISVKLKTPPKPTQEKPPPPIDSHSTLYI